MIHIIVGNTGAGKTTYANKLKRNTRDVVFSIDKWNKTLFFADKQESDGHDWVLERIERAEIIIADLILQLKASNADVILDLGFAKKSHRDKFRDFAKVNDIDFWLHYLDIPSDIRFKRIEQRNKLKGKTFEFEVSRADFDFMETWFESPDADELDGAIIVEK